MATRKATYLGQQEWLTIPWIAIPKPDFHHLLDIMAEMSSLIEQIETPAVAEGNLIEQTLSFEGRLQTWYKALVAASRDPLYSEYPSFPTGPSFPSPFPAAIEFRNFEMARIHLVYWAALLLIYNSLYSLHGSLDGISTPASLELSILTTCTSIAQSIPYLLSPSARILGLQNVFFPLRIAQQSFSQLQGWEREEKWCKDVFDELDLRGFPFGKILSSVAWKDIPSFLSGWHVQSV